MNAAIAIPGLDLEKIMAEEEVREARKEAMMDRPGVAELEGSAAYRFALAGNARFTLSSTRTGARFTFRVRVAERADEKAPDRWFVSVLTGPDNGNDYQYLGCIVADRRTPRGRFEHGAKSKISRSASSAKAFAWWWAKMVRGIPAIGCEVWHLGHCGRCGRDLTVPESIAIGLGPECAERR